MTTARSIIAEVSPKLGRAQRRRLFGDVWERPGLSKRDRSLITVASLIALYRTDQLRGHIGRALDNGVTGTKSPRSSATWPSTVAGPSQPTPPASPKKSSTSAASSSIHSQGPSNPLKQSCS